MMSKPRSYPSEESALRRVQQLRAAGMWPGVVPLPDGRFRLTHDPDMDRAHRPVPEDGT
jgi:hypothetical protein